jgi:cytochrome c oxidase subunit III
MSPSVPPLDVRTPESGDSGGGLHPPEIGGGGGRDPGDGSPDYEKRLQRARIGLICGVIAVSMIFAMLTVVFFGRQTAFVLDSQTHHYVLWNTLLLLSSSLTLELARRQVAQEMVLAPLRAIVGVEPERRLHAPWLVLTALLGIFFLFGQWLAWLEFHSHGFRASTSGPSPFFYVLTGTHALHLMVGIGVLIYAAIFSLFHQTIEHKRIVVEVTRWYWHFMSALWIYVFALLWFAQ